MKKILSRRKEHRKSLLINLSKSLILHGRIVTTIAKAKTLRPYFEPFITRAKEDNLANRRLLLSYLQNDEKVVNKLFEIAKVHKDRPGGYTRITRVDERHGAIKAAISIVN